MNRRKYFKAVISLGMAFTSWRVAAYLDVKSSFIKEDLWMKRAIIAELAEMIIPKTETIGAKAASVEVYIIRVILNCNSTWQQHRFLSGIKDLEEYAEHAFGLDFMHCCERDRLKVLERFSQRKSLSFGPLNKVQLRIFGPRFYEKLKTLTVEGYCQSMLGATQGLSYDAVPGAYLSCTSLTSSQKSWATK